jgi:hypothetical protein
MDRSEILAKIKEVAADKLDADPGDVTEEASFVDDLGPIRSTSWNSLWAWKTSSGSRSATKRPRASARSATL